MSEIDGDVVAQESFINAFDIDIPAGDGLIPAQFCEGGRGQTRQAAQFRLAHFILGKHDPEFLVADGHSCFLLADICPYVSIFFSENQLSFVYLLQSFCVCELPKT